VAGSGGDWSPGDHEPRPNHQTSANSIAQRHGDFARPTAVTQRSHPGAKREARVSLCPQNEHVLGRRDEIQGHMIGINMGRHRQMNVAVDKTGDDCTAREIQRVPVSPTLICSALADEAKSSVLDEDLRIRQGWCAGSVY
jgi:hypothetical protein